MDTVYNVTGVHHGSQILASSNEEAIAIFKKFYNNEEVINVINTKRTFL